MDLPIRTASSGGVRTKPDRRLFTRVPASDMGYPPLHKEPLVWMHPLSACTLGEEHSTEPHREDAALASRQYGDVFFCGDCGNRRLPGQPAVAHTRADQASPGL